MQVLTILFALVAPIIASIKHEGKDHRHPRQQQQRRQPVGGLGMLATPSSASAATATPTPTPIPSMASSVTEAVPTISSYLFPTTVIQVPVATVCPDTPASEAMFPILPVSSLASMAVSNATRGSNSSGNNDTVTSYVPVQVNATALLPNGSTIVFLSVSSTALLVPTSRPLPSAPGASPEINNTSADNDDAARIVLDANGCQTVFSAITTRLCSTTLSPAGMIPVPVTDCDQWVTFSSQQRLDDSCSTPAPAGPSASEATAPKVTPTPAKYYLAHWYDLAQNAVPNIVRMLDCPSTAPAVNSSDDSIAGCVTSSESWYVTSSTTTSTGSTVASFSGPAIITAGSYTLTTTLSFESTLTTTTVVTSSGIARYRLGGDLNEVDESETSSSAQTVTILATMPTNTVTVSLDSVARTTVTVRRTSTVQVTQTSTRTLSTAVPAMVESEVAALPSSPV